MKNHLVDFTTQKQTLRELSRLTKASLIHPRVHTAAIIIADSCKARKDLCELRAIYDAVRDGTPDVPGLEKGIKYMADPSTHDYWVAPHRLLQQCEEGACAEDCESQAMMVAALAASIGFAVGLRAWGSPKRDGYQHLFGLAKYPKVPPEEIRNGDVALQEAFDQDDYPGWRTIVLDVSTERPSFDWSPPIGRTLTAWIYKQP